VNYTRLSKIAEQTGAASLLETLGIRDSVSEMIQRSVNPAEREKLDIIHEDFLKTRKQLAHIADGAPQAGTEIWMISTLTSVWAVKLEGILSLALRTAGYLPKMIYLNHAAWPVRYHKLFGLRNPAYFTSVISPDKASQDWAADFIRSGPGITELVRLEKGGIAVGRIALSNYLYRNKFQKFDIKDPATLDILSQDLATVAATAAEARVFLRKKAPQMVLLLEKGLSPMAELFAACVAENIPVVQYCGSQETNSYVLKRFSKSNSYSHPFSLDASTWDRVRSMKWSSEIETELMTDFENSYAKGTWFNRKFLHEGKKIKSAAEVREQLQLDPSKKTAVIFSHVLWDATFFYGEGLFENYESWLLRTVNAACANSSVNWVIKLHPDLVWKLKYEGYTGELRDTIAIRSAVGTLPEHVQIVLPDTDISSYSFFEITDYCLTVRGTIGIEMACYGVPVITAGTGRYSGLGFTIDSKSEAEYLDRISRIQTIAPMDPRQTELARRFAYTLFKRRPWKAESFEVIKKPIGKVGHPLDDNIEIGVDSYDAVKSAPDLQAFAQWVASGATDYMKEDI
jgi:hypothetical protein